jgi:tetratricopeptide (TPR) repeat protein
VSSDQDGERWAVGPPWWAAAAAIAVTAAAAYSGAVRNGFVNYDDAGYVQHNPHVLGGPTAANLAWAATATAEANWHPLTWVSLQLDAAVWGSDPAGYHLTNVVLHVANSVLLFLALARLTGFGWPSAAAALLWAVHPLRVESVAWVAERKDVLSGLFWVAGMWLYARYAEAPSAGRMVAVTAALAAGLLAKPMLVTFPCALLLLDAWPLGRLRSVRDLWPLVREKWPLFALAAGACGVTVYSQAAGGAVRSVAAFPVADRVSNAAVAYVVYLRMTFWPDDLAVLYPLTRRSAGQGLAAAGVLAAVTYLGWRVRRSAPYVLVGWLWFLGTLVPVIGLVQVGEQAYADRFTYLPHIGLFVAAVWAAADLAGRYRVPGPVVAGVTLAAAVGCVVLTRQQVLHWVDGRALWSRALAVTPVNPTAHMQLGSVHLAAGESADALRCFLAAAAADPAAFDCRWKAAFVLQKLGQGDDAELQARAALPLPARRWPDGVAWCWTAAADGSRRRGDLAAAAAEYRNALAAADTWEARTGLGGVLARLGQLHEAVPHLTAAAERRPDNLVACNNLGTALSELSRWQEAVEWLEKAAAAAPADPRVRLRLAVARLAAGQPDRAAADASRLAAADPNWAETAARTAWALSTHPDPAARRGEYAFHLSSLSLTAGRTPARLDAVAAAAAETGRFPDAVAAAEEAVRSSPEPEQSARRARLDAYRAGRPHREPPPPR